MARFFEHEGRVVIFDHKAFRRLFDKAARANGGIGAYETSMAQSLCVTAEAVHNWRMGTNGPGDIERIEEIAAFLGVRANSLMKDREEKPMVEPLKDYERAALSRVYVKVFDFLCLYSDTDGFVWKTYDTSEMHGAFFRQFGTVANLRSIERSDLAYESFEDVVRALEREYVNLGHHPLYAQLDEFIEGTLLKVFDGKLDPDYRVHPHEFFPEITDWTTETDAMRALDAIVDPYLVA